MKLTGKPVITVVSLGLDNEFLIFCTGNKRAQDVNIDRLIERLERDEYNLIAVWRALLSQSRVGWPKYAMAEWMS